MYFYIVASEKKNHKGGPGVQFQILKNPGTCIDFHSGFRKKNSGRLFIVASEKKTQGGGGCNSKS